MKRHEIKSAANEIEGLVFTIQDNSDENHFNSILEINAKLLKVAEKKIQKFNGSDKGTRSAAKHDFYMTMYQTCSHIKETVGELVDALDRANLNFIHGAMLEIAASMVLLKKTSKPNRDDIYLEGATELRIEAANLVSPIELKKYTPNSVKRDAHLASAIATAEAAETIMANHPVIMVEPGKAALTPPPLGAKVRVKWAYGNPNPATPDEDAAQAAQERAQEASEDPSATRTHETAKGAPTPLVVDISDSEMDAIHKALFVYPNPVHAQGVSHTTAREAFKKLTGQWGKDRYGF